MTRKIEILIGLQGSGKSTYAEQQEELECAYVISTDRLRKKHYGGAEACGIARGNIFKYVFDELSQAIKNDYPYIILDATNVNSKKRVNIIKHIQTHCRKINIHYDIKAIVFATPIETLKERVLRRDKDDVNYLPLEILKAYIKRFEIPFEAEGWDDIQIVTDGGGIYSGSIFVPSKFIELCAKMDIDQNNIYHNETLLEHSKTVERELIKANFPYSQAGTFHDVGKLFTKETSFNKDLQQYQSSYYGHANYSAYYLLTNPYLYSGLYRNFLPTLFIINYHMQPLNWDLSNEKQMTKMRKRFGDKNVELLLEFNKADKYRNVT